jgi:hypothetical protein
MDLSIYIPNNSDKWIIDNNIIYYNHYCKLPMLINEDDNIWIVLDMRNYKQVLILTKHLVNKNLKFYYINSNSSIKKRLSKDDIYVNIIENYFNAFENELFFDGINKLQFDITSNLSDFMTEYNCLHLFKHIFESNKKYALNISYDYYSGKNEYKIKREEIRDFIVGLEREIKINIILP